MLLGGRTYTARELTYAGGLFRYGHCGNLDTGESAVKTQTGTQYVHYRCRMYKSPGHPRVSPTESELDEQIIPVFKRIRQNDAIREWFPNMLRL